LSDTRVRQVSDVAKPGQAVRVKVLEVDEDRRRISLSLKEAAVADYAAPADVEPAAPRPEKKRKKPLKGGLDW